MCLTKEDVLRLVQEGATYEVGDSSRAIFGTSQAKGEEPRMVIQGDMHVIPGTQKSEGDTLFLFYVPLSEVDPTKIQPS